MSRHERQVSTTAPLLVRDRPWSFGLAVVFVPLGFVLFLMGSTLAGGNARSDEVHELGRVLGLVFVLLGGLGAWRARRCRFDPGRRAFVRGERVAIELRHAALVVLWHDASRDGLNAIYAVNDDEPSAAELLVGLNARDAAAGERLARATLHRDPALTKITWGLPPDVAGHVAEELARGLQVACVRIRGSEFVDD